MADSPRTATEPIHLTPDDYYVLGPDTFGSPGLWARECVGPFVSIESVGPLLTIHDSRFDPHRGIGRHPHRGMERLFYILEGSVDHEDSLNDITGHMGTGDLGILTEGRRGMLHSEWNNGDTPARAYILVYPADPLPPTASFDAIRDDDAPREHRPPGVENKLVVDRAGSGRLHGDIRRLADTTLRDQGALDVSLDEGEAAVLFVVEGVVDVECRDGSLLETELGQEETLLVPPDSELRQLSMAAQRGSRTIHVVTGPGFGLRFKDR